MSEHMLHILAPARGDSVAAIVGDRAALENLRNALEMALHTGAGGVYMFNSDGEGYALAVALEDDMYPVHTTYAGEFKPRRSERETVPLRAVTHFREAVQKARQHRDQVRPWHRGGALLTIRHAAHPHIQRDHLVPQAPSDTR